MKTLKDIATARLLNQHLLRPLFTAPQEVVSWMGAMQAQDFSMCRWAVGVRMRKPSEAGVIEALNKGDIIRSHLNRSTWQLVTKEDYHWMMPLHRERSIRSWCAFAKQSGNPISDKMMDNSRELLTNILGGKKHLTREDIIPFYQEIDIDNAHTVRHLLAVAEAEGIIHNGCTDGRKPTGFTEKMKTSSVACRKKKHWHAWQQSISKATPPPHSPILYGGADYR